MNSYFGGFMKSKIIFGLIVAMLAAITSSACAAVAYNGKTVGNLQGFYDGADCFYFKLNGVTEADPIKANDPWFAISRSQYGTKDALAVLLAAKVSGMTVHVSTRGTLVCGYAGVAEVTLE
jgi:hypothetical protein